MTTRPIPARVVPRRSWALPFGRANRHAPQAPASEFNVRQRATPPTSDEDFLRRLREAGL